MKKQPERPAVPKVPKPRTIKLMVSQLERAAMAPLFRLTQSRGGTAEIMIAQDDLDDLLGLAEFAGTKEVEISKLSTELVEIRLSEVQAEVLKQMLGWPGQNPTAARLVVQVLRRLAVATAPKA